MTRIPANIVAGEMGTDIGGDPTSIKNEYDKLKNTIIELYDERVWFLTDAALSVHVSCILADTTNPVALIFVAGPSTEKTTVLDFFDGLSMNYRIDKFTPASFLTQSANVSKKKLEDVDLLRKIIYKVMQVPEMAPTFNQPKEILMANYAILARVLDGSGLINAGGIHGERRATGDYLFGFLGATTPLNQTAWNTMNTVGSRLIFLNADSRLTRFERLERSKNIMTSDLHYRKKKKMAKDAVSEFLKFFFKRHEPIDYTLPEDIPEKLMARQSLLEHCGYLPRSVVWDRSQDDQNAIDIIAVLAEFLTSCRKDIKVWTERTEDGRLETNSSGAVTEGVDRYTAIAYNVARCHALVSGRQGVSMDDIPLLIAITLSSLPDDRRKGVELLLDPAIKHKESELGRFTTDELMASMSWTDKTAKVLMEKLKITGIGRIQPGTGSIPAAFILHDDYGWFATDEFQRLYRMWPRGGNTLSPQSGPKSADTPF